MLQGMEVIFLLTFWKLYDIFSKKGQESSSGISFLPYNAGIAQLVEYQPSKLVVAGSNPVPRSNLHRKIIRRLRRLRRLRRRKEMDEEYEDI